MFGDLFGDIVNIKLCHLLELSILYPVYDVKEAATIQQKKLQPTLGLR